jgi:hypothetical protein
MNHIAYNTKIIDTMQKNNSIVRVRANSEQEFSEIDKKQEFRETERDLGFFKGIFLGIFFAIPLWFLIVRFIEWLIHLKYIS